MQQYLLGNQNIDQFIYPILAYPPKVYSLKLDKTYLIDKKLMGIRGQYLLFDDGSVFNMRSHSGYKVRIEL